MLEDDNEPISLPSTDPLPSPPKYTNCTKRAMKSQVIMEVKQMRQWHMLNQMNNMMTTMFNNMYHKEISLLYHDFLFFFPSPSLCLFLFTLGTMFGLNMGSFMLLFTLVQFMCVMFRLNINYQIRQS